MKISGQDVLPSGKNFKLDLTELVHDTCAKP